jgi:hypothetical protein
MPNKSFSIYSSNDEDVVQGNGQLVIEIARSYIACILTKENKRSITCYEFFAFNEDEAHNFPELYNAVLSQSSLLNTSVAATSVFINDEFCIPVPIFKFNKEIAADYLDLVFGEDPFSITHFEHLPVEPGIINVYRINEDRYRFLDSTLQKVSFHHTYSNIIKRLSTIASGFPSEFINIQFYNTTMIVAVLKEGNLQLIQTFVYETPEDVLYYLLNITQQFQLFSDDLTLRISGMIDLDFKLYRELITYFKKVIVENVNKSNLQLNITDHPLHYFAPFFNLTL